MTFDLNLDAFNTSRRKELSIRVINNVNYYYYYFLGRFLPLFSYTRARVTEFPGKRIGDG